MACLDEDLVKKAFLSQYHQQIKTVTKRLAFDCHYNIHYDDTIINWHHETLIVINRQYVNPKVSLSKLTDIEKTILHCIFTRHCDGYVRQAHLQQLVKTAYPKIATPFIIRLFGDYVIEVLLEIEPFVLQNMDSILGFINANPTFWNTQKSRVVSYWNEYYRCCYNSNLAGLYFYEKLEDYPIWQLVLIIEKNYETYLTT